MIAYIEGTLMAFTEEAAIVRTAGGVGYEVHLPSSILAALPKVGEPVAWYVHTRVLQDGIDLFGFKSFDDLEFFRALISIDKLGPKKAMAILSRFSPERLREIAFREDVKTLSSVPGIGPKSARQILWFLKEKIEKVAGAVSAAEAPEGAPASEFMDALAGLCNLGYAEQEARALLKDVFEADPDMDAAGAIRAALKQLAKNR